jgi:hypothetical protein
MSPSDKDKVGKFGGTNYPLWSYKMRMLLTSKGLWGQVDGSAPKDVEKDSQAHTNIVLRLEDSQIVHVMNAKSAAAVWKTLEGMNKANDISTKLWLKEKYATFRYSSDSMEKHIEALERLILDMKSAECVPDEDDICATMLRSLPSSYDMMVQAIRMSMVRMTYTELIMKIKSEAVRQKDQEEVQEQTAMFAKNKKFKGKKSKKDKKDVQCYNCGKMGHYKNECRSKKKSSEDKDESYVAFHAGSSQECKEGSMWVIDSGASNHMCSDKTMFSELRKPATERYVSVAKAGTKLKILGIGTVNIKLEVDDQVIQAKLEDTLLVEDLARNLFSVSAVTKRGMKVEIGQDGCKIKKQGKTVALGRQIGSLVYLNVVQEASGHLAKEDASLWHRRFGHASSSTLKIMQRNGMIDKKIQIPEQDVVCETCALAKQTRETFKKEPSSKDHSGIVCSDVMGPITPVSVSGNRYVVTFIHMGSRLVQVYPMKTKDEVPRKFKEYCEYVKTNTKLVIKTLRSDNGGEYKSKAMTQLCKTMKVKQEFTIPYNPEQNGMAERMNRTLTEMVRCMLQDSKMDKKYWAEAIITAAHIRNSVINASDSEATPFELATGVKPDYQALRVFGSVCYSHIPKQKRSKLDNTSKKCRMLGYLKNQHGYRLLEVATGNVIHSRSVKWCEESRSQEVQDVFEIQDEDDEEMDEMGIKTDAPDVDLWTSPPGSPRRSGQPTQTSMTPGRNGENEMFVRPYRKKKAIIRYQDEFDGLVCLIAETNPHEAKCLVACDDEDEKASSFQEIMKSKHKNEWKEAMDKEIKSIKDHQTWELVPRPRNQKVIGSRWIFKIKRHADGSIERYKARFCAKGYTQKFGVDYSETFAPVVKHTSIRTLFALAAKMDLEMYQFDVNTAFLYGIIDADIYMEQPDGYIDEDHQDYVCKLKKSLYGTKQAARQWNQRLHEHMRVHGFNRTEADHCVYIRTQGKEFVVIVIYVDDLIVLAKTKQSIDQVSKQLKAEFDIKELGEVTFCLGIQVKRNRSRKTIEINQEAMIDRVAERFKVEDCKPTHLPADANSKLIRMKSEEGEKASGMPYRELVGSLMYIMVCTRPDICNAVGEVSKFCEDHGSDHWIAALKILKYLKTTKTLSLVFNGMKNEEMVAYADASWASDQDNGRSVTGYVVLVNGTSVSWKSKRQPTVAMSSTEAEYMALFAVVQEVIWMRRLLNQVLFCENGQVQEPTIVYQDNKSTILLANNPSQHSRTKHINTKFHFTRDQVNEGTIKIVYKSTEDMVADVLTKAVSRVKLKKHAEAMGMKTCGVHGGGCSKSREGVEDDLVHPLTHDHDS